MLATGIPDYDPMQIELPPSQSTWTSAAWNFFSTSPTLEVNPGQWNGIPSNCMGCSVGRMFTIAANYGINPVDCYGACGAIVPDGRWDGVIMGELSAPCSQVQGQSATCTITYLSNGSWQGGTNNSGSGIFLSEFSQQSGLEGISAASSGVTVTSADKNRFRQPPLPVAPSSPCPPDSHGYCSAIASTVDTGTCITTVGPHPTSHSSYVQTSYVFQGKPMAELLQTVRKTVVYTSKNGVCVPATTWSPWNPATYYNDPNLF
jgi:hypothetical protein